MTRKSMILNIAFAIAAVPAFANWDTNTAGQIDQIASVAKRTQVEALEVGNMLRAKNPDYERVSGKMQALAQHSAEVNRLIEQFEASAPSMTTSQRAEFDRLKELAQLVNIFVTNKNNMLEKQSRDRRILRAKAEGIAKRAGMLHDAAVRIRS